MTPAESGNGAAEIAQYSAARKRLYAEFITRTEGRKFTKSFNSELERVMRDPLATIAERVRSWIKRYSWGHHSLYAVNQQGEFVGQSDCATELGIDKTSVSHAVAYLKKRGYVVDHDGRALEPVISPELKEPPKRTRDFERFFAEWKVAHSAEFEALSDARSTVKALTKVVLSDYKKWRAAQTGDGHIKKPEASKKSVPRERSSLRQGESAATAGDRARKAPPRRSQQPPDAPADDAGEAALFEAIRRMQAAYPRTDFSAEPIDPQKANDRLMVQRLLAAIGGAANVLQFELFVAAKFKGLDRDSVAKRPARSPDMPSGPRSLGLLWLWAQDFGRSRGIEAARHA